MNISPNTLKLLKNFATINGNVLFRPGKVLETVAASKAILASAEIEEDFPQEFAIFDLNELLNAVGLFQLPTLEIKEKNLVIKDEKEGKKASVTYYFTDKDMISLPPDDKSKLEAAIKSAEIKFTLTAEDFQELQKSASIFGSPNVVVKSDGKKIVVASLDLKNPTSHVYSLPVGKSNGDTFSMVFLSDNFKMIPGSYEVSISSKNISHFKNTEFPVSYYVSLETGSEYTKK